MPRNKNINLLLIAFICSVIVLSACNKNSVQSSSKSKQEVTIALPVLAEMPFTKELNGTIVASDKVNIVARVSGYLEGKCFKDGQMVTKGQKLFQIEQTQYAADLDKAKADLTEKQAGVVEGKGDYLRHKGLYESPHGPSVSQREVEKASINFEKATAALLTSQAQLKIATENLSYTEIKAPFDGKTGSSVYSVGTYIGSDSAPLVNIISLNPISVEFYPDEKLFTSNISDSSKKDSVVVNLILPNGNEYEKTGTIDYIDNQIDRATGTIKIKAVFQNPNYILLPGEYVKVILKMPIKMPVLLIPQRAVMTNQGGDYVYIVNKDNIVESKRIKTGNTDGKNIVVLSGLESSYSVVVSGLQKIKDGDSVNVKTEGK